LLCGLGVAVSTPIFYIGDVMLENSKVVGVARAVGVDDTGHAHAMRGTLKLFAEFQIADSSSSGSFDRNVFKRVTLATYYGVKSTSDFGKYVAKFKFLNPNIKNEHINYEYVIRQFG
jgi:hypothetical protein